MQPKMKKLRRHIPEEILTLILQRLPAKSLLRFRCVQKSWYHLIQSPLFITAHSNCQKKYLVCGSLCYDASDNCACINSSPLSLRFDDVQCKEYYRIHQQYSSEWCSQVKWYAAASHGLICYSNFYSECDPSHRTIWLWNPAIRKLKILPDPPPYLGGIEFVSLAFGFCQKANDFKVVKILNKCHYKIVAVVYSLNTNSWKKVEFDNLCCNGIDDWVFLNGTAYFMGLSSEISGILEPIVASYDTYKDKMRAMPLPDRERYYFGNYPFHRTIRALNDSLVLFCKNADENGFNMWILKESCWEKKISVNFDRIGCDWKVLGTRSNGEIVLRKLSGYKLVSYNVDKDEGKDFSDSFDQWFEPDKPGYRPSLRVDSFSESLVLINT